jgi:hypothetical protein
MQDAIIIANVSFALGLFKARLDLPRQAVGAFGYCEISAAQLRTVVPLVLDRRQDTLFSGLKSCNAWHSRGDASKHASGVKIGICFP